MPWPFAVPWAPWFKIREFNPNALPTKWPLVWKKSTIVVGQEFNRNLSLFGHHSLEICPGGWMVSIKFSHHMLWALESYQVILTLTANAEIHSRLTAVVLALFGFRKLVFHRPRIWLAGFPIDFGQAITFGDVRIYFSSNDFTSCSNWAVIDTC